MRCLLFKQNKLIKRQLIGDLLNLEKKMNFF